MSEYPPYILHIAAAQGLRSDHIARAGENDLVIVEYTVDRLSPAHHGLIFEFT